MAEIRSHSQLDLEVEVRPLTINIIERGRATPACNAEREDGGFTGTTIGTSSPALTPVAGPKRTSVDLANGTNCPLRVRGCRQNELDSTKQREEVRERVFVVLWVALVLVVSDAVRTFE
ncbi:hypothetical protein EDB83DRAFT_2316496 [Lactarius deliciosus]|nr:hypothetical protein EDB83DRAFT_2316496 [Lactarius deliciosus]